ncbi:MAG: hypothetical protein FJ030_08800 [Chloroflexi bacterium]|nr:hypothetical protein [Chloroflexota bacterium]
MPDAPRKYFLITDDQVQAARKIWPQVSNKTWVVVLKRTDEPMVLNKAPHRGLGLGAITVPEPEKTVDGMHYRRDMDVLILISGETGLLK